MNKEQLKKLEADLWRAADSLRANSDLKASEYSTPVLGLIFLKFADNKYREHEKAILAEYQKLKGGRLEKTLSDIAIERCGFYLPDHARYAHLLGLPEKEDIANALKKAMLAIEEYKPELAGVLPHDEYFRLTRSAQNSGLAQRLLKIFADIPQDASGDLFGKIYEYFLSNFALSEGQGGGEFFTPRSVVKLMVEIIEPHGGKVFDPACGSGGMFVQSAEFIAAHRADSVAARHKRTSARGKAEDSIYVYGQEKTLETVKLAKMNLAVNGLRGTVIQANIDTPIVPKSVFEGIGVLCPPKAIQQKIAAILSTYDDLISNNQRRITLLERMAEDIYREWFVRLRFPGYADAIFEKGIPAGWSFRSLGDVLELCYGKALKDEDRQIGAVPVYGSGGVVGTHNKSLIGGPGIVVGRKGNVGSVFWSDRAFFPIDTAYFVRSTTSLYYLVFLLRSMNFINNDSAVPGLNRQQAYSNKLLFPSDSLIKQFTAKVKVLFDAKRLLAEQNEVLKSTRNSLLPRLISGKLSVDALDIHFPPGMQQQGM